MIARALDASQVEPRRGLRKKECSTRDARPLSSVQAPGDLRRERQKQLVDHSGGEILAEDRGASFVHKEADREITGKNFQDRLGTGPARFARRDV